jgi:hypothetical protein
VDGPGLFESDGSHDVRSRFRELTGSGMSSTEATGALTTVLFLVIIFLMVIQPGPTTLM